MYLTSVNPLTSVLQIC